MCQPFLVKVRVNKLSYVQNQNPEVFKYETFFYTDMELQNLINEYLPSAVQNRNVMYGENVERCVAFTLGHALEGGEPDEIIRRSELFKMYTKRICELFKLMNLVGGNADVEEAAKSVNVIVDWCCQKLDKNARLDGIFAAHIALLKGDVSFEIPIKTLPTELNGTNAKVFYKIYKGKIKKQNFYTDKKDQERIVMIYLDDRGFIIEIK